jgi:hypothetical protein
VSFEFFLSYEYETIGEQRVLPKHVVKTRVLRTLRTTLLSALGTPRYGSASAIWIWRCHRELIVIISADVVNSTTQD